MIPHTNLEATLFQHFKGMKDVRGPIYEDSIYELSFLQHFSHGDLRSAIRNLESERKIKVKRLKWRPEIEIL